MDDFSTDSSVVQIPLSKGCFAIVDKIDSDFAQYRWHANRNNYAAGGINCNGKKTAVLLHRVIMERVLNRELERDELVDHIDRNVSNNTRSNLRLATYTQNVMNRKILSNSKAIYKGTTFDEEKGLWRARLSVKGKRKSFGYHSTPEAAARAYNAAALEHYGEYAYLNVVPEEGEDDNSSETKAAHTMTIGRPKLKFTGAQSAAFNTLLERTGETFGEFVQRCAQIEAEKYGIIFPVKTSK